MRAAPPQVIHWQASRGQRRLVLRVDPSGHPHGLIEDARGAWFAFDERGATGPVRGIPGDADVEIDLVFAHHSVPIVQIATRTGGFAYQRLDGTPLPSW